MILLTHPKQKNVTVLQITVVGYLLEKHDNQIQSNVVNRRLSSHFFAASRAKLKRFVRSGPYHLTFFFTHPLKTTRKRRGREREREETGAKVEGHYTNCYYGGKIEKKVYCSEGSRAVPVRPSGEGGLEIRHGDRK